MNNITGISLYLQEGIEKNSKILNKAIQSNISYVFTTLNIPEKSNKDILNELKDLANLCYENKVKLMVDISPQIFKLLNLADIDDLLKFNINCVRLDYGFTGKEISILQDKFEIILNASTLNDDVMLGYGNDGVDLSKIVACHNYYPKEWSGLDQDQVLSKNRLLKKYNIKSMTFVCGDEKRGPLFAGLPTVEEHRHGSFSKSLWSSKYDLESDIVVIGDIDLNEENWGIFTKYQQNVVILNGEIDKEHSQIYDMIYHDRRDSSPYVLRFSESRIKNVIENSLPRNTIERNTGAICLSNIEYGRYSGEIEIARKNIPSDKRVNVIGMIVDDSIELLEYVKYGQAFMIKQMED